MSLEYEFLLSLPSPASEQAVMQQVSALLDVPVVPDAEGSPRVEGDGLLVYSLTPDELDKPVGRRMFDLDVDLSLVFVNLVRGDDAKYVRAEQNVLRVVLHFAEVAGARAVLVHDYSPDAIILKVQDGRLIINQDWDGGAAWPEILEVIPLPHRVERLSGNP
jgi:hypothetical protein